MASIIQVRGKWRAQIRRRDHSPLTRTFATRREAEAWARQIEASIDGGAEPKAAARIRVGELIAAYRQLREHGARPIDPTSNPHYMLQHLADDLGHERVVDLTPARLVQWASMRKGQGAGPYTVNMELSALGTVIRHAASFLNLQGLPDVTGAARPLLLHLQLIGGGNRRTRRPTDDELDAILRYVEKKDRRIADALRVAAITGLRRAELVQKLRWDSLDAKTRAALIRSRKHPRRHLARDEWVPLLGEAWDIVQRQPRTDERVFPVTLEKITDTFTAARRKLGIPDLRLHDLRHLASSRLQELGFDDVERMQVLGHKALAMNARYTHPTLAHLHEKFDAATKPRARRRAQP